MRWYSIRRFSSLELRYMKQLFIFLAAVTALACISICSHADDSTIDIDRIKADAAAAHPTDPVAASKAANKALERRIQQISKTKNDAAAAKELAALAFLGYYTKNVFEIPSVCKE